MLAGAALTIIEVKKSGKSGLKYYAGPIANSD
jgi:hypothetical protein